MTAWLTGLAIGEVVLRPATGNDWKAIADLHAESWRATYRGALGDRYLASEVVEDRRALWQKRFDEPEAGQHVIVAERGTMLVGFGCAYVALDSEWGSLLDNLHVRESAQGRGLGKRLLRAIGAHCAKRAPDCDLYLWVIQKNDDAVNFYLAQGAENVGSDLWDAPGGTQVPTFRLAWKAGQLPGTVWPKS
ncbi:MAG: N-acetyltransferase family protein [Bacillota bacterium]